MKKIAIAFILLSAFSVSAQTNTKTLLAIFAHPDDEGTVAPVLAKYASEGVKVYLAIATDGRLGTAATKIPGGDELAAARKLELQCAAEKLGINPPIMFGLHDQLKMGEGMNAFETQMDTLKKRVKGLFEQLQPDVVLTWNASGWSGHHDHRLVGAVVTEVFESKRWIKPLQLYYAALPAQHMPPNAPGPFASVDKSFLTVTVAVSESDYAKAKASMSCHVSQFPPAVVEGMQGQLKAVTQGTWYFRPHSGDTTPRKSLF